MTMVLETTNQYRVPESCEQTPSVLQQSLHQLWVTDTGAVDFLRSTEVLAAVSIDEVDHETFDIGLLVNETWAIQVNGSETRIDYVVPANRNVTGAWDYSVYWGSESETVRLQLHLVPDEPDVQVLPVRASFGEPSLPAHEDTPVPVRIAPYHGETQVRATLERFGGSECEE